MDSMRVWPSFRREHVLYEDDDLIAVHKPSGVPSQAARLERPDDLVTRLKRFLTERDGTTDPYLGVHQRLDRDTSGVVLFTKRPSANAALARQFEGRTIEKRYFAAVSGIGAKPVRFILDDKVRKGGEGRMEVVRPARIGRGSHRPAVLSGVQRAVTHVHICTKHASRALVELRLETGRTHQARVQLAHARLPIAGDTLYAGEVAPRLLLHAAGLKLLHPASGKTLQITDPVPCEFADWVSLPTPADAVYDDAARLDRALALCLERRWGLGTSARFESGDRKTTAFRLVNEEGDGLPGLAVDVYGSHLVAQFYLGDVWCDSERRERVLDRLDALGFDGIYLKLRPKQANVLVDTRRDDVAPARAVRGVDAPVEFEIHEEGIPYRVRLGDGLSTGIFLDQRANRTLIRQLSDGARVLNLFSYTCGFSVAAALGGATATVSIDASVVALERGRANFETAGIDLRSGAHAFVAEDVFAWLTRAASRSARFDIIIVDPPSYSSTKKRRFVAESDYDDLVALAAKLLTPQGKLLACCNHRGLGRPKFRRLVKEGMEQGTSRVPEQVKDLPDGADFPASAMQSVLATAAAMAQPSREDVGGFHRQPTRATSGK